MLSVYKKQMYISLKELKNYLLLLSESGKDDLSINLCSNEKQLKKWSNQQAFEGKAYQLLKEAKSYKELEYHLIMMNYFFDFNNYTKMKERILENIFNEEITLKEYCLIRHLVGNHYESLRSLLEFLFEKCQISHFECAKIALLEDEYELALEYIYKLDYCCDEMLFIIKRYRYVDYLKLTKHFNDKARSRYLVVR